MNTPINTPDSLPEAGVNPAPTTKANLHPNNVGAGFTPASRTPITPSQTASKAGDREVVTSVLAYLDDLRLTTHR